MLVGVSVISPRRYAWLDDQLTRWQTDGVLTAETADAIRARYTVSTRISVARVVLGLGAAFLGIGLIWLVAANLDRLSPGVRFGGALALWAGLLVLAELLRGYGGAVLAAARLLAVAGLGAVIFQAAQSLQVPAYSAALLGWWAAGALLYAYTTAGLTPLAAAIALAVVWFVWSAGEQADSALGFAAGVLVAAALATAIGVLHEARWRQSFAAPWRLAGAALALVGLFVAALPVYRAGDAWQLRLTVIVVAALAVPAVVGPTGSRSP